MLCALIFLLPVSSMGGGKGFVVIRSGNLTNYNNAVISFKTSCGSIIGDYNLKGDVDNGMQFAEKINSASPAAVFVVGVKAAIAAKKYVDSSIPIVYAVVLNPGKYGLDGGNFTGVSMDIPVKAELQAMKGIIPGIHKLGALYNPKNSGARVKEAYATAKKLGIDLVTAKVDKKEDTLFALKSFAAGIDAFWLLPDPTVVNRTSIVTILKFSFENRIPIFAFHKKFVQAGVLLSLSPSYEKMGSQACEMAKKIAAGTKVSDLPPEPPSSFEIAVNVKTARNLNLQEISMNAFGFAASHGFKIDALQ